MDVQIYLVFWTISFSYSSDVVKISDSPTTRSFHYEIIIVINITICAKLFSNSYWHPMHCSGGSCCAVTSHTSEIGGPAVQQRPSHQLFSSSFTTATLLLATWETFLFQCRRRPWSCFSSLGLQPRFHFQQNAVALLNFSWRWWRWRWWWWWRWWRWWEIMIHEDHPLHHLDCDFHPHRIDESF